MGSLPGEDIDRRGDRRQSDFRGALRIEDKGWLRGQLAFAPRGEEELRRAAGGGRDHERARRRTVEIGGDEKVDPLVPSLLDAREEAARLARHDLGDASRSC